MKKIICACMLTLLMFPAINALGNADRDNAAYKAIETSVYE